MARLEGESTNSLFEVLEDWNTALKSEKREIRRIVRRSRGPSL